MLIAYNLSVFNNNNMKTFTGIIKFTIFIFILIFNIYIYYRLVDLDNELIRLRTEASASLRSFDHNLIHIHNNIDTIKMQYHTLWESKYWK
jgi:hypothetical protein